jgi:hypothetical protein
VNCSTVATGVSQGRVLGAVFGLLEIGVVGLVDFVPGLSRRVDQVARHQLLLSGKPQCQRLRQAQIVALRHRRHVQVTRRRVCLGAFDVDDLLAVDLAERVERRARAK